MLAAELGHESVFARALLRYLRFHSGTISLHHAKEGRDYPTIRLPHTFAKLVGLPTRIHWTIHNGVLAFLVVVAPQSNTSTQGLQNLHLHTAEVAGSNPAETIVIFAIGYTRGVY